jgi:glycosidase
LMFLFTYTGIPVMYYGTELPMDGGAEHTGRAMMDWETEPQFRDLVTVLNGLRADYPALTEGDFDIVKRSISSFAFARWDEDEVFITVLNNADEDRRLDIEIPEEMQRDYRWALPVLIDENGEPVAPGVPDLDPVRIRRGEIRLNLPEYTGVVIRLSESRD